MTIEEIAELIQEKYGFIKKPSLEETKYILNQVTIYTSEEELDQIINSNISDTTMLLTEAKDMSDTINLLKQIQAYLNNK